MAGPRTLNDNWDLISEEDLDAMREGEADVPRETLARSSVAARGSRPGTDGGRVGGPEGAGPDGVADSDGWADEPVAAARSIGARASERDKAREAAQRQERLRLAKLRRPPARGRYPMRRKGR